MERELLINLIFSGGSADLAYLHNNKYSIEDYEKALLSPEYIEFATKLNKQFIENADLRLLGNLYRCEAALKEIGPDHKNYPSILKNYTDLLKITSPIVERMYKFKVETNTFEGLELIIRGVNDNG